jgi:thiol-disulfide isomerase/thioredoxin
MKQGGRLTRRHAMLAGLLALAVGSVAAQEAPRPEGEPRREDELRIPAPEFPGGVKWLNSPPLTLAGLKGKVVLLDFWEYTCVNCIRTFPYLKAWHQKYASKGLVIVGAHTPEFDFAKAEENIRKGAAKFGLTWPLINDQDFRVWNTWGNRYWPAKYLIDKDGFVRFVHFGEGAYGNTEQAIQKLLKEANPSLEMPPITEPIRDTDKPGAVCYPVTPELYLGYERGTHEGTLANREGYQPGRTVTYKDPGRWEDGMVYLQGPWKNGGEALISTRANPTPRDYIAIKYHALEVNAVLRPEHGRPLKVWVFHDGKPVARKDKGADIRYDAQGRSFVLLDQPKMYNFIKNAEFGQRTLRLAPDGPGMGIYTFTFSSCEIPKKNP